jgi:2'-5' RNA ligase
MPDTSRLFFALWPDEETRYKLTEFSRSIQAKNFKPVPPHNYHVTLVFLGHVNKASELMIKQRVTEISTEPFTMIFNHLSYWVKPKVICLTSQQPPEPLMILSESLTSEITSCGILTDTKAFNAHITLARHMSAFIERDCNPIFWRAESFCLVESRSGIDGVCYTVKDRWPFVKT